jgi:hypothetical protein
MWLKQHKFSYKKPHAIPAKINQEKQNEFIKGLHILKNANWNTTALSTKLIKIT